MPLVWDDELVIFHPKCAPDEWYGLKRLSFADNNAAQEAMVKVQADSTSPDVFSVQLGLTALDAERVRRSIKTWSHEHDGAPVPITPENVERIDPEVYAELVEEIDRLFPFALGKRTAESVDSSSRTTPARVARSRKR